MNEELPVPPLPPMIPAAGAPMYPPEETPLGANSIERERVSSAVGAVEAILRQPRRVLYQLKQPKAGGLILALLGIALFSSVVYGVVAGTFSGGTQLWAAPVKIAGGLFISALICLPSLYIFSCLGGSQARLAEVFGLVAGLLALTTLLLIGFAPVAWVFSQSTKSVAAMGGLHLVFWLVATIFGVRFLSVGFRHFNASSQAGLRVWIVVFLLVAAQMTTALRPIIGTSDRFLPAASDKQFFLTHWMNCLDQEGETNTTVANTGR
jgi:hypothetical protein